jgi:hypothetical protein
MEESLFVVSKPILLAAFVHVNLHEVRKNYALRIIKPQQEIIIVVHFLSCT